MFGCVDECTKYQLKRHTIFVFLPIAFLFASVTGKMEKRVPARITKNRLPVFAGKPRLPNDTAGELRRRRGCGEKRGRRQPGTPFFYFS